MSKLRKEWEKKLAYFEHEGGKVYLRRQTPFKIRLQRAINKLEAKCKAVDVALDQFTEKDKQLFSKITEAYSMNDTNRANMYVSELMELRKTVDFIIKHKLVLERTTLQLRNIHNLGGAAVTLVPAIETLQNIRSCIKSIFPNMDVELGSITDMLNKVVISSGQISDIDFIPNATNEGAIGILKEAALAVEQKKEDQLPEVPVQKRTWEKKIP